MVWVRHLLLSTRHGHLSRVRGLVTGLPHTRHLGIYHHGRVPSRHVARRLFRLPTSVFRVQASPLLGGLGVILYSPFTFFFRLGRGPLLRYHLVLPYGLRGTPNVPSDLVRPSTLVRFNFRGRGTSTQHENFRVLYRVLYHLFRRATIFCSGRPPLYGGKRHLHRVSRLHYLSALSLGVIMIRHIPIQGRHLFRFIPVLRSRMNFFSMGRVGPYGTTIFSVLR